MSIGLYARVLPGEPLTGFGIDDRAKRLFLELACAKGLYALGYRWRLVAERIVKAMMRAGVLRQQNIASGSAQTFEIRAAWRYWV